MKYFVGSYEEIEQLSNVVDLRLGYPRHGEIYGQGKHVECKCPNPCMMISQRFAEPFKHPDEDIWAYPATNEVLESEVSLPEVPIELNSTWFPNRKLK